MSGQDLFERITTTLNGAVFDDTLWKDAAGLIDKAAAATGNYLVTGDGAAPGDIDIFFARFCFGGHRNEELEREYFEVYHPVDERLERIRKLPDGQVVHTPSLLTAEEAKTSIMHNEVLPRSHSRDGLHVRLDGPRGSRIVWAIGDPVDGRGWSSAQVRTIERVLPHVRQFVRVREALLDAGALGASLLELLENRRIGVIQLDLRARVLAVNDCARELLRNDRGLAVEDRVLSAAAPDEDEALQRLLAGALPTLGGSGSGGSMIVSGPVSTARLVLHVRPMDAADSRPSRVSVLVLLVDPARRLGIGPERVAALLGISPAQSELAIALAEGRSIGEIAAATGRSHRTLRWHLKNIFARHKLSRQVELERLVRSLAGVPEPPR